MAEWFEEKLASQVTATDLQRLVDEDVAEDQRLDFKEEAYEPVKRHEMLKDVTALANTDGGYLLIGVQEREGKACGLLPVADARRVAEAMGKSCVQNVAPRIDGLEILPVAAPGGGEVIVVRVPESAEKPHMYTLKGRTQFTRRYGTENRAMTIEEIRSEFAGDRVARGIARLEAGMRELGAARRPVVLGEVKAGDNPLDTPEPAEVGRIMRLRFEEMAAGQPFLRLSVLPQRVDHRELDTYNEKVKETVREPPGMRYGGWTIYGMDARVTPEGLDAGGQGEEQRLVVLRNGYIEFSYPARSEFFQWKQSEAEARDHPYLYPFAMCELPVSFVRLTKALYEASSLSLSVSFELELANIRGFRLFPGLPGRRAWRVAGMVGSAKPYAGERALADAKVQAFPADPDPIAYELITQIYQQFGRKAEDVPLFDSERHFSVPDE
jgi:hypothetical protein